jgi:hypothetical protein
VIDIKKSISWLPLLLIVLAGAASAQTAPATAGGGDETQAPPRYTVEVIVFSYSQDVGVGTERFEPKVYAEPGRTNDEETPEFGDDVPASSSAGTEAARAPFTGRFEMFPLGDDEFRMQNIYDMLRRLDVYEPLMHVGWTQTVVPEESTPEFRLDRFGPVPEGLDGTLKLYLGRFVHLVVDVALDAGDAATDDDTQRFQPFEVPPGERGDYGNREDDERWREAAPELVYEPLRYRIREDRIMKSGETRYYDHPRFGVIARVTLVEEQEAAASAAASR